MGLKTIVGKGRKAGARKLAEAKRELEKAKAKGDAKEIAHWERKCAEYEEDAQDYIRESKSAYLSACRAHGPDSASAKSALADLVARCNKINRPDLVPNVSGGSAADEATAAMYWG